MEIQSILFDKNNWSSVTANRFLLKNSYLLSGDYELFPDITKNKLRYRQRDPGEFVHGSFRTFRIKEKPTISVIVGKPLA